MTLYIKEQTYSAGYRQGSAYKQTQYKSGTDLRNSTEPNY